MADAKHAIAAGVELSLRIGQRVRHRDYQGRRVTGVVNGLSIETDRGLVASVVLDEAIVIPPIKESDREIRIHWQTAEAHEFTPFDDRDELIEQMLAALRGVLRVADRATDEFDAARAAIAKATGVTS